MDNTNTNLPEPGVRPVEWYENNEPVTIARSYTTAEKIAAWFLVPLGYLFLRAGLTHPLGTMFILWALLLLTAVLLGTRGTFGKQSIPYGAARYMGLAVYLSAIPGSLALFLSANYIIHALALVYCMLAYGYGVYAMTGNTVERGLSDFVILELFRAVFQFPCRSLGEMPKAMGLGKGWKQAGKVVLRIAGGLSLTIVPTLIVYVLLRYDRSFRDTIAQIRTNQDILDHLCDFILGFVIALLVFGLYATATGEKRMDGTLERYRKTASAVHIFSSVTSWAAVAPVLCLYGIFFLSQWDNYMSAFTGTLPDAFSYATYAREGFFELCAVAVINLCLLVTTGLFTKREHREGEAPLATPAVRVLHGVLSLCTLILIATAMSKLLLYIEAYGLTVKRVYAAWFMALLALVFVLVIVKQFCPRLKLVALATAVTAVLWLGLGLANVEGRIADYNVERYIEGTLEAPDRHDLAWELAELGVAAYPAKVRAIEAGICADDPGIGIGMVEGNDLVEKGIFEVTLPWIRAEKSMRDGVKATS